MAEDRGPVFALRATPRQAEDFEFGSRNAEVGRKKEGLRAWCIGRTDDRGQKIGGMKSEV